MSAQNEKPIDRLVVAGQKSFLADYRLRQPVVLTGGLSGWPDTLFDLARLAHRFGAEPVLTYRLPSAVPAARMSSVKSDFHLWSDGEGHHEHLCRWSFGEFVLALQRGEAHYCMANRTKNTRLRNLLAAEAGEVRCAPIAGTRDETDRREFFLGSEGAGPGLHHDGAIESFLCQLVGAKRVNAFPPTDIPYLYPAASWLAPTGHFSAVADSFNVDTGQFPLFGRATVHGCRLDPGDILYLPPHWYHDTAPEGPSVSMTIRHSPPAEAWGTRADRESLAKSASELFDGLRKLSPVARMTYIELLRRDLAEARAAHECDRSPPKRR